MTLKTTVIPVSENFNDDTMRAAAQVILSGGLVAFPTETVYGLGANALDSAAIERIFAAKERPASDPIIAHIHTLNQLKVLAQNMPDLAYQLAERFWPGPLTLILPRAESVPTVLSAGLQTVAVRMPNHPIALALLKAAGVPIGAPSANLFSRPSPTRAEHVLQDLAGRVDLILDGGPTTIGLESSVLDLTQNPPRLLRPGGISLEALQAIDPRITLAARYITNHRQPITSPGTLLKHYSPQAEVRLFTGPRAAVVSRMSEVAAQLDAAGERVGVLVSQEAVAYFAELSVRVVDLGVSTDMETVAQRLFAGLRSLDSAGVEVILTHDFGQQGLGLAIWDRLLRAAEGRLVRVQDEL